MNAPPSRGVSQMIDCCQVQHGKADGLDDACERERFG
jgi:hypothetical protein